MINYFYLAENDTQLELIQGEGVYGGGEPLPTLTITYFVPLPDQPLEVQSEDPKLWTLHLVNVENTADGRAFTLDEEEKEYISAFLKNHKLT